MPATLEAQAAAVRSAAENKVNRCNRAALADASATLNGLAELRNKILSKAAGDDASLSDAICYALVEMLELPTGE